LSRLRGHHIGFVFQNFHLIPALNVFENVSLPLFYSQKDHSQKAEDAVNGVLQKVGLEHRRFHKPMELSGGEMQRTAIARAMVMEPEVILADEPTGNLDSKTGFEILAHFQKFHEGGGTVIMITHDLEIAKLAPKRLNLKDGIFVEPRISHPQTG
jgi:putative ABC transport system ATP-binding protein